MTTSGSGGPRVAGWQQQVHPVDYVAEASQRLVDAAHRGDLTAAMDCLANPMVDVNYAGAVRFKCRRAELVPRKELASLVRFHCEEFPTDVSPLFLAAHSGDLRLLCKLLSSGADVNQKLFRGFASTAAVREGREEAVELLLRSGTGQDACEEAVVEASRQGRAGLVELIMGSELVRPHIAAHALVTAVSHGFVDVVDIFLKLGVDANAADRMLLLSVKPSLYANVNCTAIVAAVVSRQFAVVRQLMEAGVRTNVPVRLGAWSWDTVTGEEFRVGAGLAEPYDAAWCAVEYFESSGEILRLLLRGSTIDSLHHGRSLLHHSILCACPPAAEIIMDCGANGELPVRTALTEFRPVHMAARLGQSDILRSLISHGCDVNARNNAGETALMLSARYKQGNCIKVLALANSDFGLLSSSRASASLLAANTQWIGGFREAVIDVVCSGAVPFSSNTSVFALMPFVANTGHIAALEVLLGKQEQLLIDERDENGFTAAMMAAKEGHVDAFRLLVFAGANVQLKSNAGETAIRIYQSNKKSELFEQVMLEYAVEKGGIETGGKFYGAFHSAVRWGDLMSVRRLISIKDHDVNLPDGDGYTPLMLAAREGHDAVCELLIANGALCDVQTSQGETALSLARIKGRLKNRAEEVILDELARRLVVGGGRVKKHTKQGKGSPHGKVLRMAEQRGVLRWGRWRRRSVVCTAAELGASPEFERNRKHKNKGDAFDSCLFRVVTRKGREVHFVCDNRDEAELWVRGIMLVTMSVFEAKFS